MSCNNGPSNDCCLQQMINDPCVQKLCCQRRPKIVYRPFIPSYERAFNGGQCGAESQSGCPPSPRAIPQWCCEESRAKAEMAPCGMSPICPGFCKPLSRGPPDQRCCPGPPMTINLNCPNFITPEEAGALSGRGRYYK